MTGSRSGPSLEALLEHLGVPAFACDEAGVITFAAKVLVALAASNTSAPGPSEPLVGRSVQDVFGVSHRSGGASWRDAEGRVWRLVLEEGEGGWFGQLRPVGSRYPDIVLQSLSRLGHELDLPLSDDELIRVFTEALQQLLPSALLCIRLVDPVTGDLLQVYAKGQLREQERNIVTLSREGLETFGPPSLVRGDSSVGLSESYTLLFEGASAGFDVPLHDGRSLLGVVSIEYRTQPDSIETERRLVSPVAFHLSTALCNSRKLGESIHLREYLDNLLDLANAPILVTDRNRRVKIVNQSFERLTGYQRRELMDTDVLQILHEDDRDRFLPALINALRGESTSSLEVRIPRKGGKDSARIALSTAAIKSGFGEIDGAVAVGQDLTELRILQQQVIHSEKLATLGQLAAGVVHELNNPLTSISVYSEYLLRSMERSGGDEADLSKLRRICEGADRILRFTRDLMAYARPTGEEPRLVDLREVVSRALVFCEHVVQQSGVDVTTELDVDLPPVYGVEGHLLQVLVNLITNACDAMENVGGRLRIEARAVADRVRLVVADSGQGIQPDDAERIFEPFYTSKAEGRGTGLGLSIVRNIITNHNGTVTVAPTPGGGATFVIELFAGG